MVAERTPLDSGNNGHDQTQPPATQQPANTTGTSASSAITSNTSDAELHADHSQPLTAMDLAYEELQRTIHEATAVQHERPSRPRLIKSHISALQEDITLLASFDTLDDVQRTRTTHLVLQARRLKRHLERHLIDSETEAETAQATQLMQLVPCADTSSTIQLAPVKPPTFSGNAAEFHMFRGFYEENVLHNNRLTDTAKWLRLTESLIGPPAELISEIPQTSQTLCVAWKLLVDIYGGDDRPVVELYNRLQQLPPATLTTTALRLTHSKLEGILLSLEHLGHDVRDNGYIRWVYLNKFPVDIAYQVQKTKNVTLSELRSAISELLLARECVDQHTDEASRTQPRPAAPIRTSQPEKRRPTSSPVPSTSAKPLRCIFCNGEHWNDACSTYSSLDAHRDRLTGKCFICLRKQHTGTPCLTQRRCFHCDSFDHNRALCPTKFAAPPITTVVNAAIINHNIPTQATGCFLTFITHANTTNQPTPARLRVVMDTAGATTVLRKSAALHLKLSATADSTTYTGLGNTSLTTSRKLLQPLYLLPPEAEPIEIFAEMVDWIIPDVPTADIQLFRQRHPQYDEVAIPPTGGGEPIDLLIGSDMFMHLLEPKQIIKVDDKTLLLPTKFGSLILGRTTRQQEQVCHSLLFNITKNPLYQMCNLDLVGLTGLHKSTVDDEQKAIENFYETVNFADGRYSIGWPWKFYPPNLNSNFGLALGRLRSLHRRLRNSPHILADYHDIIQKQLHDGIIEEVELQPTNTQLVHYLPHHPVLQPGKSTSLRPVYDGSARSAVAEKSLNDNILKGKNWLNDLVETLLRFRRYKNVATADIAKAFHQISINPTDRDVARFIWLKNPSEEPTTHNLKIYRFTRVAFGIVASPFILSATIQHHAKQQPANELINTIVRNMYADNLVVSLPDHVELTEFYSIAKQFFHSMGMNLTKWTSNNSTLLAHIPLHDQATDLIQSALGLIWCRQKDEFTLQTPKLQPDKIFTRRTVAREMASYFDPLGWATPILLLAKSFFRKVWSETESWDVPLTDTSKSAWIEIAQKLKEIQLIKLPRSIGLANDQVIQLHAFVDASLTAYAIVVYVRIQSSSNNSVQLISSKSRLTPTKTVTIPKLELTAILLGTRYVSYIKKILELPETTDTFVWSDSICALSWVKLNKILPAAVEKCVEEAKSYNIKEFRYVPSEKNFADVATRGADFETLRELNWWSGPHWLHHETQWPSNQLHFPEKSVSLIFQSKLMFQTTLIPETDREGVAMLDIKRFSSLPKLLLTTAYVFKAVIHFRKFNFINTQSDLDLLTAEKLWLKWDQSRVYALQNEPQAGKQFLLRNLTVFRDDDGLIRCNTRINNAQGNQDLKSPVLLVKDSSLTKLIILHTHTLQKHAGTNHTLTCVRQKYWLPHGHRQVYKTILQNCYVCRRQITNTYTNPPPAPLPEYRVLRTQKPFQVVGVDIFGPFVVRHVESTGYLDKKRWVLIFTCATIRAIHLEIITEMTTIEIAYAFRKFIARRGVPRKFLSDNAPQFHALDGYFHSLWHTVVKAPALSSYFAQHQILWEFITEMAPWMGAIYERLIKSVKVAFEKTYGSRKLLSRQFETVMTEIEAMINARPLTYVDRHPDSPILTPNDFLMAQHVALPIQQQAERNDDSSNKGHYRRV